MPKKSVPSNQSIGDLMNAWLCSKDGIDGDGNAGVTDPEKAAQLERTLHARIKAEGREAAWNFAGLTMLVDSGTPDGKVEVFATIYV